MGLKVPKLIRTKWGFYQYTPPPKEYLREYYEKKYYQKGCGGYDVEYTREELDYFKLRASLIFQEIQKLSLGPYRGGRASIRSFNSSEIYSSSSVPQDMSKKILLDVGCGEGWIMDKFFHLGVSVLGLDFSRFALEKFHPHLVPHFQQGDIYDLLNEISRQKSNFDFIVCSNVLEHVVDPVGLLSDIKQLIELLPIVNTKNGHVFGALSSYLS